MKSVISAVALWASAMVAADAPAAPAPLATNPAPVSSPLPIVAELFTSQGCNSCPPADTLLGELARDPTVIALAFHVQYWDGLGWSDRFGLPEAARRQSNYVRRLQLGGSFTPQLIVNADHSFVGSNRAQVLSAVPVLRAQRPAAIAIKVEIDKDQLQISIPSHAGVAQAAEVVMLPLLATAASAIGRGENSGRTLREYNIVRAVKVLGQWQGSAVQWRVSRASLPADADGIAILLQEKNQGALRGAILLSLH
jgi:hypothetical protein